MYLDIPDARFILADIFIQPASAGHLLSDILILVSCFPHFNGFDLTCCIASFSCKFSACVLPVEPKLLNPLLLTNFFNEDTSLLHALAIYGATN